jgi:carboxypeptidase T
MKRTPKRRSIVSVAAALCLVALALFAASGLSSASNQALQSTNNQPSGIDRHSRLRELVASVQPAQFNKGLSTLKELHEPGALEVWAAALNNRDNQLSRAAWQEYDAVKTQLMRDEFVPQVFRVGAAPDYVLKIAADNRLDANVWATTQSDTIVAAPRYLAEQLSRRGHATTVLFDSIAEWDKARNGGDALARSITPEYQSDTAAERLQVRIAVIDLSKRQQPAAGYSDWLGDTENILMREGSLLAFLDVFESDGTSASIAAHINQQYTARGYTLKEFVTAEEFATVAPRMFAGRSFNPGRRESANTLKVRPSLSEGKFHSYDEAQSELKSLASAHPDLARYVKLGTSFEGRDIFALKITRDPDVDDGSKPEVLITGCHHAREWISVEAPMFFANQLVMGYPSNDSIRYLVDNLQIWIIPIVNPDGLTYSQGAANESLDPIRLWRKNRRPISIGGCASSVGVDLNRNYNFEWRLNRDAPCTNYCSSIRSCTNDDIGASDDPASDTYRGTEAESEPEIKAMKALVDDPRRHFRVELDYHNFNQLILYPWGYQENGTADAVTLSTLAQKMSEDIQKVDSRFYKPEQSIDLYATTGSSIDYAYGVNKVAAPFAIEMRPDCCDFFVPESEIPAANAENWAGAQAAMTWAVGPPILQAVQAYSKTSSGSFSKLIYSARWVNAADPLSSGRQLMVDTRFPGIDPGPIQLRLQFSKSMNTSLAPRVTIGRDSKPDELTIVETGSGEGWQRTVYQNDTWIGETVISQDTNLTSPWKLSVAATDALTFSLDALPATIAGYATGTGQWRDYEDSTGQGSIGGTDAQHSIAPTLQGEFANIFIASPSGGERLAGGDQFSIAWTVPRGSGFLPIQQELWFSTDGGIFYERLAEAIPGNVEQYTWTLPTVSTTRARVRLVAIDGFTGNALVGDSIADFTIGSNVGTPVEAVLLSAERADLNWTDVSSDDPPVESSGSSRFTLDYRLTNRGTIAIANPFLHIAGLNRGNVLLTRDPKSRPASGARQSIPAGSDNLLSPGESVDVRLVIGLVSKKKFNVNAEVFGVASVGSIPPGPTLNLWNGKPKNR